MNTEEIALPEKGDDHYETVYGYLTGYSSWGHGGMVNNLKNLRDETKDERYKKSLGMAIKRLEEIHLISRQAQFGMIKNKYVYPIGLDMKGVLYEVAMQTGVRSEYIKGRVRRPEVVVARHGFINFCHHCLGYGSSDIGRFINKNHASVIHAYSNGLDKPGVFKLYRFLQEKLKV